MSKQFTEEDPMKRKSNITTSSKILASAILMSGFVALALHSALAAKTDAAATSQVKQKEFDTPQQAADSLVQAAESFDVPVLERDPRTRKHRPRQFPRSGRGQESGGRICCEGQGEEFSCPGCGRIRTALFSRLETTIFLFRFQS